MSTEKNIKQKSRVKWIALNKPEKGFWCSGCCRFEHDGSSWYSDHAWNDRVAVCVVCSKCGLGVGEFKMQKQKPNQ